ncbi:hypothetical protein GIB67_004984 [Kingdonia uniflora]|uniref:DUF6469 domain-containing protein n=1 Tax=Kingdonia uniflora TaxID=39325 RepID=A0A7J7NNA5_9MAGN|nr:hypothetical protein GIB67_004984 [Kingdonia uniflora]
MQASWDLDNLYLNVPPASVVALIITQNNTRAKGMAKAKRKTTTMAPTLNVVEDHVGKEVDDGVPIDKGKYKNSGVHHALNPDPYRGCFGFDRLNYVEDVYGLIDYGTSGRVTGFIAEAIQGVGGIVELAPGDLPAAYKMWETRGELYSSMELISNAPFAEVTSLKDSKPYGSCLYDLNIDSWRNISPPGVKEPYKAKPGDILIISDSIPEIASDLQ